MLMYTNQYYMMYYQRITKALFYILGSYQLLGQTKDMTVLDCGCGNGLILREMLHFGFKPENCQGFDPNPMQIELGRPISPSTLNIVEGLLPQADWCGDFERDITMCIGVLMFMGSIDNVVESLANIRKMTKAGGLFITLNTHTTHYNPDNPQLINFDFSSNELAKLAAPFFREEVVMPISRSGSIYGPVAVLNSLEQYEQESLDVQLMKVPVTHFMSVMRAT